MLDKLGLHQQIDCLSTAYSLRQRDPALVAKEQELLVIKSQRMLRKVKRHNASVNTCGLWASKSFYFGRNDALFSSLLRIKTNQQSYIDKGIEYYSDTRKVPKVVAPDEVKRITRKVLECPVATRMLTKKSYAIFQELCQYRHHRQYAGTADGLPISTNVCQVRAKGIQVAWVVGVGKDGDNEHTHYKFIKPKGMSLGDFEKALKPLRLKYFEQVEDTVAYALYMAKNYDEKAQPGILRRGTRRYGIGGDAKRLSKEDKQTLHPYRTKAEIKRWEHAKELVRKAHNICPKAKRYWVRSLHQEIKAKALSLPLKHEPLVLYDWGTKKNGVKGYRLNLCGLRQGGYWETYPLKDGQQVHCMVVRLHPTNNFSRYNFEEVNWVQLTERFKYRFLL